MGSHLRLPILCLLWFSTALTWAADITGSAQPCLRLAYSSVFLKESRSFHIRRNDSQGYEVLMILDDGSLRVAETPNFETAQRWASMIKQPINGRRWIEGRAAALEEMAPQLQTIFASEKGVQFRTRIKKYVELREKIFKKVKTLGPKFKLEDVDDIAGARFIVQDPEQLDSISDKILKIPGATVKREIIAYKRGYRAHHLTIETPTGNILEVQVMTERTYRWSNWDHDLIYKPDPSLHPDYLKKLRDYGKEVITYLNALDNRIHPLPPRPSAAQHGIRPEHAFLESELQ